MEQNINIDIKDTLDIDYKPSGGCCVLLMWLLFLIISLALIIGLSVGLSERPGDTAGFIGLIAIPICLFSIFLPLSLITISPNEVAVLTFCGKYKGTIKQNGFFSKNPFYSARKVSTKLNNFNTAPIKVNDKSGNPIMIAAIVSWRIINPAKSVFDVENVNSFIDIQTEAAIRRVAYSYNYDLREGEQHSLKDGHREVNVFLRDEIASHLQVAGVEIHNAEISNLSYAPEIANAMLKKQQAEAVVSARRTIIDGAVSMCGMAISSLESKNICKVKDDERAKLVSNLLVVLCSESQVSPVLNTSS